MVDPIGPVGSGDKILWPDLFDALADGRDLTLTESHLAFTAVLAGDATP
nr:hypothetical protein [Actinomycetota bacterium]